MIFARSESRLGPRIRVAAVSKVIAAQSPSGGASSCLSSAHLAAKGFSFWARPTKGLSSLRRQGAIANGLTSQPHPGKRQEGYTGQLPEHFPAGRTSKPQDYVSGDVTSMWGRGLDHCATTLKVPSFFSAFAGKGGVVEGFEGLPCFFIGVV
jgi:hypothetical protein